MKKEGAFIYQGEFSLEGEWPTLYEETHKDHLKSSVATPAASSIYIYGRWEGERCGGFDGSTGISFPDCDTGLKC